MSAKIKIYGLLACCFLWTACESEEARNARREVLIQAEVKKRMEAFMETRTNWCYDNLMERVNERTDSILMEKAQELIKKDTLVIPNRPEKPERPTLKSAKDTSAVEPIIQ